MANIGIVGLAEQKKLNGILFRAKSRYLLRYLLLLDMGLLFPPLDM
jgi:hypothetical protein